jgi:hypothetical protein
MSNLPLYNSLSTGLVKKDLTAKQKTDFLTILEKFDTRGYELVYALIRVFQIENEVETVSEDLPYGGVTKKSDIVFDFGTIPIPLRQILYKFAKIHEKSIKETAKLEEHRNQE